MPEYTHGGDTLTAQTAYGGAVLDFSANLNPLGMPPQAAEAAAEAARNASAYPDPLCRALRAAIAAHDGVGAEQVICGNGAADLIFRLAFALKPRRALVTAPTFSEYAAALGCAGCEVASHLLRPEDSFDLGEDFLQCIDGTVDLVLLCTPNNPTGRLIHSGLLEGAAARCQECGARLVVDECFLPLSDGAGPGLVPLLSKYPNLFLLRAFTKSYAMAGLRLGYGLSADLALLETLYRFAQPWSVSTPAQAAGVAALGCPQWPEEARALVARERPRLAAGLEALGLTVTPGQANYLLFRAPGRADLREAVLTKGILIRSCANYRGLDSDYYRVCVRTGEENGRLLSALREVL